MRLLVAPEVSNVQPVLLKVVSIVALTLVFVFCICIHVHLIYACTCVYLIYGCMFLPEYAIMLALWLEESVVLFIMMT